MGNVGSCCEMSFLKSSKLSSVSLKKNSLDNLKIIKPLSSSIADFEDIIFLAEGDFSRAFIAKKKFSDTYYALKRIKKNCHNEPELIEQLLVEEKVMLKARHPFITKLYYTFQSSKYFYYVMEWVKCGSLSDLIEQQGKLTEDAARFYAAQIILALKYLHEELSVLYRDLKPENILIDEFGNIKLTDFGLSKSYIKSRRKSYQLSFGNSRVYSP